MGNSTASETTPLGDRTRAILADRSERARAVAAETDEIADEMISAAQQEAGRLTIERAVALNAARSALARTCADVEAGLRSVSAELRQFTDSNESAEDRR